MCSKNSFESPDSDWISSRLCSQRDVSRCASAKSSSPPALRAEEHTSELQSHSDLVCRLLLEKKKSKLNFQGERGRRNRYGEPTKNHLPSGITHSVNSPPDHGILVPHKSAHTHHTARARCVDF